jgi:hypothetical protein
MTTVSSPCRKEILKLWRRIQHEGFCLTPIAVLCSYTPVVDAIRQRIDGHKARAVGCKAQRRGKSTADVHLNHIDKRVGCACPGQRDGEGGKEIPRGRSIRRVRIKDAAEQGIYGQKDIFMERVVGLRNEDI